ncbi:MAG: hypothetical protein QOF70_2194, partial [Acetobacteraceae bacterium]|nr:hypothetical protein [Acetobacteraceae bacterium]
MQRGRHKYTRRTDGGQSVEVRTVPNPPGAKDLASFRARDDLPHTHRVRSTPSADTRQRHDDHACGPNPWIVMQRAMPL